MLVSCCQALSASPSTGGITDGIMTFVYDSTECRTTVIATCAAPTTTPSSGLVATMIANGVTILASNTDRVSVTGQCNANRVWVLGTPGLQIQTLSCGLSQPTTTTTTTTQAARF
ncbi:unnamed protein product [Enterobius vermicularis]|uniref:C6 domain-containing protein n=1 Tax=Enterobius vermicularis TaxID=51028 RepID=A0A0N4VQC4_ENTVE|nr:unnamed protein product [Enterobius vermicularis]